MYHHFSFLRLGFLAFSTLLLTVCSFSIPGLSTATQVALGVASGLLLTSLTWGIDLCFKRCTLRAFHTLLFGLFVGYVGGQLANAFLHALLEETLLPPLVFQYSDSLLLLLTTYLAVSLLWRSSEQFYLSIPFVKLTPTGEKRRELLVDISALADGRLVDLAASGLVDQQLVIPRFLLKELQTQADHGDEAQRQRTRRALEHVRKLESMPTLGLRYDESELPEVREVSAKFIRLAKTLPAHILTSDISKLQTLFIEGVRYVNIHALSYALKPFMQTGECIKIKIQRYGKEPKQGIGYLEDGTMVVVNGGGDFIGDLLDAKVLSVKQTVSGRIIFCNALDGEGSQEFAEEKRCEER
jgi:uncharacterized protein YacL